MEILQSLILLLGVIAAVAVLAQRMALPAPVLLAIAGIVWSLSPLPRPRIPPEVILSVFLPPLIYADAWTASWLDFRRWLRPILQLSIGLVAFTIVMVGLVAHWAFPSLPWAACFLVGAIVSPTDTVAVHAVLERLRVPRRVTAILGGESLVNDATALLAVELATVVLATGVFEAGAIGVAFARIAGGSIVLGAAVGIAAAAINRVVRGTQVLFAFSLLAPYLAFYLAEKADVSPVLAVVVAGFVASWRIHYIAPESRVELYAAWDQMGFLLNALMFLYVGVEAPAILMEAFATIPGLTGIALLVSATVVVARVVWVFPGAYLPPWLLPRLRQREGGYPPWRAVLLASWCGMRGAVSLAAALSLPAALPDGSPLPGRTAIIGGTMVVILVTLIGQGVTLLPLVRRLGLSDTDLTEEEVRAARETMLRAGINRLDGFCSEEKCPVSIFRLRDAMSDQLDALRAEDAMAQDQAMKRLAVAAEVRQAVYQSMTDALLALRDHGTVNDRVHQELQLELDRANADVRSLQEAG